MRFGLELGEQSGCIGEDDRDVGDTFQEGYDDSDNPKAARTVDVVTSEIGAWSAVQTPQASIDAHRAEIVSAADILDETDYLDFGESNGGHNDMLFEDLLVTDDGYTDTGDTPQEAKRPGEALDGKPAVDVDAATAETVTTTEGASKVRVAVHRTAAWAVTSHEDVDDVVGTTPSQVADSREVASDDSRFAIKATNEKGDDAVHTTADDGRWREAQGGDNVADAAGDPPNDGEPPEGLGRSGEYNGDRPGLYKEELPLAIDDIPEDARLDLFGGLTADGQLQMQLYNVTGLDEPPTTNNLPPAVGSVRTDIPPGTLFDEEGNLMDIEQQLAAVRSWLADNGLVLVETRQSTPISHGMLVLSTRSLRGGALGRYYGGAGEQSLLSDVPYSMATERVTAEASAEEDMVGAFIEEMLTIRDADGNVMARAEELDRCDLLLDDQPAELLRIADPELAAAQERDSGYESRVEAFKSRMLLRVDDTEINWHGAYAIGKELIGNWLGNVRGNRYIVLFRWPGTSHICFTYFGFDDVSEDALLWGERSTRRPKDGITSTIAFGRTTGEDSGERGRGTAMAFANADFITVYTDENATGMSGAVRKMVPTFATLGLEDIAVVGTGRTEEVSEEDLLNAYDAFGDDWGEE